MEVRLSAFKHHIDEADIIHAWNYAMRLVEHGYLK